MNLCDIFIFLLNILAIYYMYMSRSQAFYKFYFYTKNTCVFKMLKGRRFIEAERFYKKSATYVYILYKSFYYTRGQLCRWYTCNSFAISDYSQDCPSFKNFAQLVQNLVQTFSLSSSKYTYIIIVQQQYIYNYRV